MGLPLAATLSLMSDIPYVAVRKRPYGMEGEVKIEQSTGYSNGVLYLNGVRRGDRVVVVDDVLSTGGTLRGIIEALRQAGAEVADVLVVADKGGRAAQLEKELGVRIQCLVRLEVSDGRVAVK
jgi:adenine phosphoribosyltransferase